MRHLDIRTTSVLSTALTVCIAMGSLNGCGGGDSGAAGQAPPVTVDQPLKTGVNDYAIFTGSTRAIESADVVARVAGELRGMHFVAGSQVKKGDILFTIEKEKYQAARDAAFASLQSAKADLARSEAELTRIVRASESRAVSEMDVDRAKADRDMAKAAVLLAKAELADAELNLSYTDVRAPISGLVGRKLVDVGNLVGQSGPTLLTTVNHIDPIYVYFNVPETLVLQFLSIQREMGGNSPKDSGGYPAHVSLADETGFPHEGLIDFIDNTVDPQTGTIEMRIVLDNDEGFFFPGLFVRVKVAGKIYPDAVVIPETALGTDLGGKYVYVVGENNIVEQRYVILGLTQNDGAVHVREGLEGDETVIVNGIMFARPGMPVTPLTAEQFAAMQAQQADGQ